MKNPTRKQRDIHWKESGDEKSNQEAEVGPPGGEESNQDFQQDGEEGHPLEGVRR